MREPEWDDRQVDLLLASRDLEIRDSTGHLIVESTDPDANPAYTEGPYYFIGDDKRPIVNWAVRAEHEARERFKKANKDTDLTGYHFPVRKVTRKRRPTTP